MYRYTRIGALVDDYANPVQDYFSENIKEPTKRWFKSSRTRWIAFICTLLLSLWLFHSLFRFKSPPQSAIRPVPVHRPLEGPDVWAARAEEVKTAFRHAYTGYQKHASNHDELRPVSGGHHDRCVKAFSITCTWQILGLISLLQVEWLECFSGGRLGHHVAHGTP
jgi:hypothetical protein